MKKEDERFKPKAIDIAKSKGPSIQVSTQGSILFIGNHWFTVDDAKQIRDFLNEVLP
jgi:hypothetical protein